MAARGQHPVEAWRERLADLGRYPPGVVPVPAFLPGTAFFAAAAGLVVGDPEDPLPPFPFGGVMFVAHNLDAEGPFLARLASGQAHGGPGRVMPTWRNLYRLLAAAEVEPSECFFTNAYIGLKAGNKPTGRFRGANDAEFGRWCREFLEDQIKVMRPRAIATLGSAARRFLATMAPELDEWSNIKNPPPEVIAVTIGGHRVLAAPLLHPSGYHASLAKRWYRGEGGLAAEAALLRQAVGADPASRPIPPSAR